LQALASPDLLPRHDAARNRLRRGALQTAPGTLLVLDEALGGAPVATARPGGGDRAEGQLARNVRALQAYISGGVIHAEYSYQQVRLPTSGAVLVISPDRSVFSSSCTLAVPWHPTAPADGAMAPADGAPLQSMRAYLATAWAAWDNLGFEPDEAPPDHTADDAPGTQHEQHGRGAAPEWVRQALVSEARALAAEARGGNEDALDAEQAFDVTLMLARALAVSHGETTVTRRGWQRVRDFVGRLLERRRECAAAAARDAASAPESGGAPCGAHADGADGIDACIDQALAAGLAGASAASSESALPRTVHAQRGMRAAGAAAPSQMHAAAVRSAQAPASPQGASRGASMVEALRATGQL
jgi:Mini-chromosome maintenance replisome factor